MEKEITSRIERDPRGLNGRKLNERVLNNARGAQRINPEDELSYDLGKRAEVKENALKVIRETGGVVLDTSDSYSRVKKQIAKEQVKQKQQ